MKGTADSGREAANHVLFHHSMPSDLFCLLLIVTTDLLAGTAECLNMSCEGPSKREATPGEHLQGSSFIRKSEEEGKWFQKSLSPE